MRYEETLSKHGLQLLVSLKRESGHLKAANPTRDISESNRAVADGSDNLIIRPEILECLCHVLIREQIESSAPSTSYMNRVVTAPIDILQLQRCRELRDKRRVGQEAFANEVVRFHR